MRFWALLLFSLFLQVSAPAAIAKEGMPPAAAAYLASLPGGTLTLGFVLSVAKRTSDTFAGISSLREAAEGAALRAEAPFAYLLTTELFSRSDALERSNPFEPSSIVNSGARLGMRKLFLTGTAVDAGVSFGPSELKFPPGTPGRQLIDYDEARFDIGVRQSLWKNAFGAGTRLGYEASKLAAEGKSHQHKAQVEAWALGIAGQFYQAWLAQNQLKDAKENLSRRERLLGVTRVRMRRGTAERPDLLAAEAAVSAARVEERQARESLQLSWLTLATAIKLPEEVASQVDPLFIPMALDELDSRLLPLCQKERKARGSWAAAEQLSNRNVALAEKARAETEHKPDLSFNARWFTNGIDSSIGSSASEALQSKHKGWQLALNLELPLGMDETAGKLKEARSQAMLANARAQATLDEESIAWNIRCRELERRGGDLKVLRENAKLQAERANLEQNRFSIGRVRFDEVMRAEDEALMAGVRARLEEVELRRTLWALRQLSGSIPESVEALP